MNMMDTPRRLLGRGWACLALGGISMLISGGALHSKEPQGPPPGWDRLVATEGQAMPIPEAWLSDAEARIAHSLKPPAVVPKPVPFDFEQPLSERLWFGAHRKASIRYFNHLCSTEAGQWIVRTVPNVEGVYFARPPAPRKARSGLMGKLYGPENPWMEREFVIASGSLQTEGGWFVSPPHMHYRFVEQPHRKDVDWQKQIADPYVRIFGLTRERSRDQEGRLTDHLREKTPMQVIGIPQFTARYGYTWRGIKRSRDREHGIAGGELLIYDLQTKEVLALRRQFVITMGNRRNGDEAAWEVATPCRQAPEYPGGREFSSFAASVLKTIEPSLGKK
ncbi:hypothetical protein [Hydrogenophaga sp.]|uniref:hypothetical protein n=1 Tax=Hydrogenophaga sp. TaxID=1904254 RepID=UPI003F72CA7E